MVVDTDLRAIPSYWLSAFYDPKSFLGCLIQTRARTEGIPMRELRNEYDILDMIRNTDITHEKNVYYLHGLSIEGAAWDFKSRTLVETTSDRRYLDFPAIRVRTICLDKNEAAETPIE